MNRYAYSQASGSVGEQIAELILRTKGCKMVADMPTSMRKVGNKWIHSKKVQGDIRAVLQGGRSVLCEVKRRKGDRLPFSALRTHQVNSLNEHHLLGGLSLLVWINDYQHHCLEWPIPGFQKGQSLKLATAGMYEWAGVEE